jgi:hypothetical protein
MRCSICHRPLSDPESVERGIGPICWKKILAKNTQSENPDQHLIPGFDGDVICKRGEGWNILTNIPQVEVYHSPSGFEWGYGGSGPADFALNILMLFTDKKTAYALHQAFKWDFIAAMPKEGGTIKGDDIKRWIEYQKAEHELSFV